MEHVFISWAMALSRCMLPGRAGKNALFCGIGHSEGRNGASKASKNEGWPGKTD
jgi:hypothetical protein